jgi:rhamnose transport system ATP-binding protein
VLDKVGAGFSASTLVKHLSLAQRHLVEIARALSQEARVVILDEPTAALSQQEIRDFYELVRHLKSQDVAVLFITHKFDEIFSVCDRYVVLRDGATVGTGMIKDTDKDSLIRLMAGREIHQIYPAIAANTGPVVLQVQHLNHPSEFSQINFELRRGEILGFYGLVGAGRSEIMLALMGLNNAASGIIKINGQQVTIRKPADAIGHGLAYVPEERQLQGGILDFAVMHNLSIADLSGALGQRASLSIGPWLSARKENDLSDTLIEQLQIKTANVHTALGTLSGGNQQKVVIGKWLGIQPNIIILDEPTKGIDVGAKQAVYRLIADMVAQGLAVILVSSELPEVMHLAHRIVVMRRGRMAAVFDRDQADAQEVVAVASGLRTADKEVHA